MRRLTALTLAGMAVALFAACGGGTETSDTPNTVVSVATPGSTSTTSPSSGLTPVSAPATPTVTATAAGSSATPEATPATAAPTTAVPTATSAPTGNTPAPTQAVPPTPTAKPSSGNPSAASVGVTGTGTFFWSPSNVSIAPGGTVTFAWSGATFHDLSIPALGIENGATKSASYPVTFANPGSYAIICQVHPSMKGTVTVQ